MFDFVRKKKDKVEKADRFRTETDVKNVHRNGCLRPSEYSKKVGKKRSRYFSVPFVKHEDALTGRQPKRSRKKPQEHRGPTFDVDRDDERREPDKPRYARARDSSCSAASSYAIRNPFRQDSAYSSTLASHDSLPDCLLSPENLRYVPSHVPFVVSPHGEQADVFFPFEHSDLENAFPALTNPSAEWAMPSPTRGIVERRSEPSNAEWPQGVVHPLDRATGVSLTPGRASADYLQVNIPGSTMSPIPVPCHSLWSRL
ncbi:predicted protein [Sparassis crispa]|uniref:Uncharacterized protein n=1 Tax=Sparassis crispa TaxID=139825 RepID=A0A401GK16_9APHY|nr:predicted protein [Sparassis crispa]GBE82489.1 predicted protein [Sparassis crispa]